MFMYERCVIIISRSVIVIHNPVPLGLFFAYNYANFLCRIHQLHRLKLERLRRNPLNIPKNSPSTRAVTFDSPASSSFLLLLIPLVVLGDERKRCHAEPH